MLTAEAGTKVMEFCPRSGAMRQNGEAFVPKEKKEKPRGSIVHLQKDYLKHYLSMKEWHNDGQMLRRLQTNSKGLMS
jgi:hypothetical protein